MTKNEIGSTVKIAQKLISRLPKEMADELKPLIQRAKDKLEPAAEIEIIDLLTSHENIRRWMREHESPQNGSRSVNRKYDSLPGKPSPIPASKKWICAKTDCAESFPVIRADEDAPYCDIHGDEMVCVN